MSLPEDIETFFLDEFVVRIVGSSLLEGRVACIHNEEDDSGCEDIHTLSFVLFGRDLWGHVAFSSQLGPENSTVIFALEFAGESKVCDFKDVKIG